LDSRLIWSGDNSNDARSEAVNDLFKTIYRWHRGNPNDPIILIGHYHGGNVAINSTNFLDNRFMKVETLITIATPVRGYKLDVEVGKHRHLEKIY